MLSLWAGQLTSAREAEGGVSFLQVSAPPDLAFLRLLDCDPAMSEASLKGIQTL